MKNTRQIAARNEATCSLIPPSIMFHILADDNVRWNRSSSSNGWRCFCVKSRCFWLYRVFIPFTSSDDWSKNAETGWILCQQSFCLFSQLTHARTDKIHSHCNWTTERMCTQRGAQAHRPHVIDDINTKSRCSEFAEAQWHWHKNACVYFYRYIQPVSQAIIQSVSQSVRHGLCAYLRESVCISSSLLIRFDYYFNSN